MFVISSSARVTAPCDGDLPAAPASNKLKKSSLIIKLKKQNDKVSGNQYYALMKKVVSCHWRCNLSDSTASLSSALQHTNMLCFCLQKAGVGNHLRRVETASLQWEKSEHQFCNVFPSRRLNKCLSFKAKTKKKIKMFLSSSLKPQNIYKRKTVLQEEASLGSVEVTKQKVCL